MATVLTYLPSLRNDFVNWDDGPYTYQNARLEAWSWSAFVSHFVDRDSAGRWTLPQVMGNYHPLTMLSLHLDRQLSTTDSPNPARETDLRAGVFHATSLILHVANTLLVFLVVGRLLLRLKEQGSGGLPPLDAARVAFLTALFFGLATLHVESVAWVSERKDVLYAFFFFVALLAWLSYLRAGSRRWYAAALAAFVLSLLSKGQAVTLPAVLVVVDVLVRRPLRGRVLLEKVPFVALALLFGLLAMKTQGGNLLVAEAAHPWWLRPLFAAYGLVHYVIRLFVPMGLQVHYTYAQALGRPFLLYVVCPLLVVAGGVTLARWWRRDVLLTFGGLFFLLNVLPVLQLLPVGTAVMADRYTYVASAGVFLLAALAIDRAMAMRPERARMLVGAVALYAIAIGVLTAARVSVWRDSESLWSADLRRDPRSSRAHNNLGNALRTKGRHAEAEPHFRTAVEIDSQNYEAWNNLGNALDGLGRRREAVAAFERALAGAPGMVVTRTNLGNTRLGLGEAEAAIVEYREALRLQPRYHLARGGLIEALRRLGRLDEAETECRAGLALQPDSLRYAYELGRVLVAKGSLEEGMAFLERAHAGDRSWKDAASALAAVWNEIGVADRRAGRSERAEQHFQKALLVDATNAMAHSNLGALLASRGQEGEAARHLREAVRLEPQEAEHVRALAWLLATARDGQVRVPGEARRVATRAVELTRGEDALALYALGLAESANGDSRQAVATLRRALAAARAAGNGALAGQLSRELN
jgi:protein O-mannosyl-transferase